MFNYKLQHTHSVRLEVTRQADLAIRALVTLGDPEHREGRTSARAFAEQLGTSAGFMSQVMNPLVKARWISSEAGRTGGYHLEVPLQSLTVLDVVELVDGPIDNGVCIVVGAPCDSHEQCPMHTSWAPARKVLMDALGKRRLDKVKLGY